MNDKEFEEKYGDVELKFDSYYKFVFTFSGTAPDGTKIEASIGGDSSDIYRLSVTRDETRNLGKVLEWNFISALRDGTEIFSHYNF
jgi:hypothetical protein